MDWPRSLLGSREWHPDDIFRRAERQRRRSANIRNAIIVVLLVLTIAAGGSALYAWQQLKTNKAFLEATLKNATEIVNDVLCDQGNLPAAVESYQASLAIANRFAKADPGNAGWQRDLNVTQNNIGDVLV